MSNFTQKLTDIFLSASGIKESFDRSYQTFIEMAEANEPMPKIAKAIAPHLRPVTKQFTGFVGRTKLKAASVAVNWKLSNVSVEEIEEFMAKAKSQASQNVSGQSKDVMDVAQKFLDGINPERIQEAMDANKGAITPDMIEDVIVLVSAVKSVLPKKLNSYVQDLVPEINDLENIIRTEAGVFVSGKSDDQIKKAMEAAKKTADQAAEVSEKVVGNGQNTLIEKLEELEPEQIKRIIDHVGENMTRAKISNLMQVFFAFADEVLEAFEDSSKPLREYEFKHGQAYQEAIAEFLQFVEDALDAEGVLPDQLDKAAITKTVQEITQQGQAPAAKRNSGPRP
jgi:DNA-directed RNA polymerase subunit F